MARTLNMVILRIIFCLAWIFVLPSCRGTMDLQTKSQRLVSGTISKVSTQELTESLANDAPIILLDTREKKEFEVSHLPGARWVGDKDFTMERLEDISTNAQIVVYCSVGYRSEKVGEKLEKAGYANVKNLLPGIFDWANQAKPLEDNKGKATTAVHGHKARWTRFLSPNVEAVLDKK